MLNPEETKKILEEKRKAEATEKLKFKILRANLEEQLTRTEYQKHRAENPSVYKDNTRGNSNRTDYTKTEFKGDKKQQEIIEKLKWKIQKASLEEQLTRAEYQKRRAENPSAYKDSSPQPSKENFKLNAFEYSEASVKDLEQKKSQLMKLRFGLNRQEESENDEYTNVQNASVTNNNNNSTNIVTDYLRNLRVDLGRLPTWRNDLG